MAICSYVNMNLKRHFHRTVLDKMDFRDSIKLIVIYHEHLSLPRIFICSGNIPVVKFRFFLYRLYTAATLSCIYPLYQYFVIRSWIGEIQLSNRDPEKSLLNSAVCQLIPLSTV